MSRIYFDYAAATPLDPRVYAAMQPYWSERFGNPGSLHQEGKEAKRAIEDARETCARAIGAHDDEIIFTASGTEANNLALIGLVRALLKTGRRIEDMHFITSVIEHSSVLEVFDELQKEGASLTVVPVDERGLVAPDILARAIRKETVLVSIMLVNNEIGSVMPVRDITKAIRAARNMYEHAFPYIHSDACQAFPIMPVRADALGADLISADAQKMYGPKGAGFLYVRRGTPLSPLIIGGAHERGLRGGTPAVPLIAGLAKALSLLEAEREETIVRLKALQSYFFARLDAEVPEAVVNGLYEGRACNNINISLPGRDNAFLVLQLDARGIAASSRSACFSGNNGSSRVVAALGLGSERAQSAVRFTLGTHTTREDIDRAIVALKEIVALPAWHTRTDAVSQGKNNGL